MKTKKITVSGESAKIWEPTCYLVWVYPIEPTVDPETPLILKQMWKSTDGEEEWRNIDVIH